MPYEHRPNSGTIFKNDRKEKDTHPDYKGEVCLPDGEVVWINLWVKDGKNGKFFSVGLNPKQPRQDDTFRQAPARDEPRGAPVRGGGSALVAPGRRDGPSYRERTNATGAFDPLNDPDSEIPFVTRDSLR